MSDVSRDEFEQLKTRVAELEDQLENSVSEATSQGLDHRDETVMDRMRRTGEAFGPRRTVKTYLNQTDISNEKTAKNRAKQLHSHDVYKEFANE